MSYIHLFYSQHISFKRNPLAAMRFSIEWMRTVVRTPFEIQVFVYVSRLAICILVTSSSRGFCGRFTFVDRTVCVCVSVFIMFGLCKWGVKNRNDKVGIINSFVKTNVMLNWLIGLLVFADDSTSSSMAILWYKWYGR